MTDATTTPLSPTATKALGLINAPGSRQRDSGFNALDQGDFLRLLTVQLQQQDPLDPVDNKDMLAQMAQFSSLAGTTTTNATLEQMSDKLDALIDAQKQASAAAHASTYNS